MMYAGILAQIQQISLWKLEERYLACNYCGQSRDHKGAGGRPHTETGKQNKASSNDTNHREFSRMIRSSSISDTDSDTDPNGT